MSGLRAFLLGAPYLERDGRSLQIGGRVTAPAAQKTLALLATLSMRDSGHSQQSLAALLWPELEHTEALAALGQSLGALQEALGPAVLDVGQETVALARRAGQPDALWLDVTHFRQLLQACGTHDHPPDEVCAECMPLLREAEDLYRGDFLAGLELPGSEAYEAWRLNEQDLLRREMTHALACLVQEYSARGEYETAVATSRRWLQLDPSHEEAHRELVARSARTLVPAAPFINRERALAEIEQLLVDDPSCRLLTLLGPGGAGKTRLAVQVVDQLGDAYADGVHVISLGDTVPPPAPTADDWLITTIGEALGLSFQGGKDPQTQLYDYVRAKEALLVLDGMEHALSSVDLVAGLLRAAPGLSILTTSRERLGLDGERVRDIGGLGYPADAPSEWRWSADAPSEWRSSADEASGDEAPGDDDESAVRLFLESVKHMAIDRPLAEEGRRAVVRICQLAEGLPLGLEMASAWVRAMSLTEIAAEIERNVASLAALADTPPGHRALRAIFARSWELLSEAEKRAVGALSVFRGGFDREAAHSVADASPFLLAALVDKALLRPRLCARGQPGAAPRYEMHELIRQFVADELAAMPQVQEGARDRHCAYYSAYLGDRESRLKGPAQGVAGDEIAAEIDNVRAAWRWAVDRAMRVEIEQGVESLYLFYYGRGWIAEGRAAFEAAIGALASKATQAAPEALSTQGQGDETLVGRLLARQARFAHRLGQYPQARDLFQASLALYDRIEAAEAQSAHAPPTLQQERAFGLFGLSAVFRSEGETGKAQQLLQRGLELYRACDDRSGMAMTYKLLGIVHGSLGQVDEAQAQLKEALNLYQEIGDPSGTANTLNDLSIVAARRGRQALAVRLNRECLAMRRQNGDRWGVGTSLNNLGYLAYLGGEHKQAIEYLSEGLVIQREIGDRYHIANCLSNLGAAAAALGEGEEASAYLYEALEIAFQIGARPLALEVSAGIGALLAEDEAQDGEQATEILTFVHDHPQTDKWTSERAERSLAQLSARLAPDIWAKAQERGRAGTLEAVVSSLLGRDRAA